MVIQYHRCPYEKGKFRHRHRRKMVQRHVRRRWPCVTESEIGVLLPSPRDAYGHEELDKAGRTLLWSLQVTWSRDTLNSKFWTPELGENKFCYFKPPSL